MGETDPAKLAALAQGTARAKHAELREALRGRITEHHRTMLRLHLQVIAALDHTLAELDPAAGKALAPGPFAAGSSVFKTSAALFLWGPMALRAS